LRGGQAEEPDAAHSKETQTCGEGVADAALSPGNWSDVYEISVFLIVPTLCVGMHPVTLCVTFQKWNAERPWRHSHAGAWERSKAGKNGQTIAGHASESMTRNYQKDHADIVWSGAIPDLNISEITG
jgi:hypothetical protein